MFPAFVRVVVKERRGAAKLEQGFPGWENYFGIVSIYLINA